MWSTMSQKESGSASGIYSERKRHSKDLEKVIKGSKKLVSCKEYRWLLYLTPVCLMLARERLRRECMEAMLVMIREMRAFVKRLIVGL